MDIENCIVAKNLSIPFFTREMSFMYSSSQPIEAQAVDRNGEVYPLGRLEPAFLSKVAFRLDGALELQLKAKGEFLVNLERRDIIEKLSAVPAKTAVPLRANAVAQRERDRHMILTTLRAAGIQIDQDVVDDLTEAVGFDISDINEDGVFDMDHPLSVIDEAEPETFDISEVPPGSDESDDPDTNAPPEGEDSPSS